MLTTQLLKVLEQATTPVFWAVARLTTQKT